MKRVFALTFFLFCNYVNAENTIIAIVNGDLVSLKSIENELFQANSKKEKIDLVNSRINIVIQLQKASELNLLPTKKVLEDNLLKISKNNEQNFNTLSKYIHLDEIKNEISEKLTILNLQRFITKNLMVPEEQIINLCANDNPIQDQKQIKVAQIIISEMDDNLSIRAFLNNLASHIKKGASFKAFAKLHSQHPSYHNGGVTEWLDVKGPILEKLDLLDKKEISGVYVTDFGFAIAIKVDERFVSSKLKECKQRVIYNYADIYYSDWLKNLREKANIKIYYEKLL